MATITHKNLIVEIDDATQYATVYLQGPECFEDNPEDAKPIATLQRARHDAPKDVLNWRAYLTDGTEIPGIYHHLKGFMKPKTALIKIWATLSY